MESRFPLYLTRDRIFSNSQKAVSLHESKKIGEFKEGKVIYNKFEALYLLENKKAEIINIKTNKKISEIDLIKTFPKDFLKYYLVYKYLKNRGYIVKTGLKFGEEFRVYTRKDKHARWIVYSIKSNEKIDPKELISKSRIAHSTGKRILLSIIDSEEDITFYEIEWKKP